MVQLPQTQNHPAPWAKGTNQMTTTATKLTDPKLTSLVDSELKAVVKSYFADQRRRDKESMTERRSEIAKNTKNLKRLHRLGFITTTQAVDNFRYGLNLTIDRQDLPKWRKAGKLSIHYKSANIRPNADHPFGTVSVMLRVDGYDDTLTLSYDKELTGQEKCKYVTSTHTTTNLVCSSSVPA